MQGLNARPGDFVESTSSSEGQALTHDYKQMDCGLRAAPSYVLGFVEQPMKDNRGAEHSVDEVQLQHQHNLLQLCLQQVRYCVVWGPAVAYCYLKWTLVECSHIACSPEIRRGNNY